MYTNPFTDFNHGAPYWSVVPLQFGDFPDPYRVGDFPTSKDSLPLKGGYSRFFPLENPPPDIKNIRGKSIYDQQVWFDHTDGNLSFVLEIPGCAKENITAEIKDDVLVVNGAYENKIFSESWAIPSPKSLDLENLSAKVENGILKIIFPAKKQEVKTIKVL
jgi:hypothetical protein